MIVRFARLPAAVALALVSLGALTAAHAAAPAAHADAAAGDAPASGGAPQQLATIEVKGARPAFELTQPGTTTVIGREEMNRHLVSNIRALVQFEPGVSAIGTGGRFGFDSFSIRGLSGNRSYLQIDGIPQPDAFGADIGQGSFRAGRDFIDLDSIRQVTILRGPISPLYPSDALGGAVILTTKDPSDYLQPGRSFYGAVKAQYVGTDRSFDTEATLAAGDARSGFLLVADHRHGHATRNMGKAGGIGTSRTQPDPLDYDTGSVLGKFVHTADSGRTDRVTVNAVRTRNSTNGLSELVPNPFSGVPPHYYYGQGRTSQASVSVGQGFPQLQSALADKLDWHLYWQQSRTRTWTQTDDPPFARFYDLIPLAERVVGGKLTAVKHVGDKAAIAQTVTYGASASATHARAGADGYGIDTVTGTVGHSIPFLAGTYPLALIPPSDTRRYALFGEDAISVAGGKLVITPGVRIERYAYRPGADATYQASNPGYAQADYSRNNIAPKLGVLWHIDRTFSAYADYAYGFRPPLFNELSGAWNEQPVPGFNIAYLPSPDLKAETARAAEIGIRGEGTAGWFNVAAYYNRYRNFIWSGQPLDPADVPPWAYQIAPGAFYSLFFRDVNASRANIKGLEASGRLQLGALNDTLAGWSLRAAAAIASGALIEPGNTYYSPLNTVDPARLVVGIAYDARTWGAELIGTAVHRHTLLSDPAAFRPGGYGRIDFYAHWTPAARVRLYAGINNLANRKYWDWGSLNGGTLGNFLAGNGVNDAGTGGVIADRLSMPGRTFSLAARIEF